MALTGLLPSCNYLADRALDFADPFRLATGLGSVIGVRQRGAGVVETGLMIGVKPHASTLGWRYGQPLYFFDGDPRVAVDQAEIVRTTSMVAHDFTDGSYQSARTSLFVLPAVFSWVDATPTDYRWLVPEEGDFFLDRHWLWSQTGFADNRYQQIHAFDVEAEVGLLVFVESGFSVGELVDFVLGIFTIDLAGDDGRLDP